jgi:hypothetical protein
LSNYLLSKTAFLRGQQCPKALFFYKYYPHLKDPMPPERLAILRRGNDVGFLARKLFPGGTDATAGMSPRSMDAVVRTQELLAAGVRVIYEAAFVHKEILVMADILVHDGTDWMMYEVKSGLRVSPTNISDAALQFAVVRGAGIDVKKMHIVHIDGYYKRRGEINLQQFFKVVDITEEAFALEEQLMRSAEEQKLVLGLPQAPEVKIGARCYMPYECDFRGQCWKNVGEKSPFQLGGISRAEQGRMFEAGFSDFRNLPAYEIAELPKMTTLQVKTAVSDKLHIDKESLRSYIEKLGKELIFVDIECFQPAIPKYEGTSPFQQLPFSFSAHKLKENGEVEHYVFLAEPGADPRKEFIVEYLKATEGTCKILAYDVSAENQILKLLRKNFPEHAAEIDQRHERMADLMRPFSEGWYHSPQMMGSISLKYVLPALVPDLDYNKIAIRNGSHAMTVYEGLEKETDIFVRAEKMDALREYSTLDTLGMVRIYEVLKMAANG